VTPDGITSDGITPQTAAAVVTFARADDARRRELAPDLVDAVGEPVLRGLLAAYRDPRTAVRTVDGELSLVGPHGRAALWAALGPDGRLAGLLLLPAGSVSAKAGPRLARVVRVFGSFLAALVLAGGVWAWTAGSVKDALAGVFVVLWGALTVDLIAAPAFWVLPRGARRTVRLALLAGVAAVVRFPGLERWQWIGGSDVYGPALALLATSVAATAVAVIRRPGPPVSAALRFPLPEGRWGIAQGGGTFWLNPHRRVRAQRAALDLVRLSDRTGAASAGLYPTDLTRYPAYGSPVVSPCAGTVRRVVDGLPDQDIPVPQPLPPAGNHVEIDTGRELVLLAHLLPGSVLVRAGERVEAGRPLGRVGNSGNSTEPHLHLHAERDGVGLRLRFEGVRGPLVRGRLLRAGAADPR